MAVGAACPLTQRDWTQAEREYEASAPYNFAVLDGFFTPPTLDSIRSQLLANWGWQYKNWQANELYVRDPEIAEISMVAAELKERLPQVLDGLEFVRCWAFMHQQNVGLKVHADNGAVTVDVWMTPDEFNLVPGRGRIVFYDVKREPDMMIHEFNTVEFAEQYFEARTQGDSHSVPYRFNRAILFDAGTFHESDQIKFVADGAHTYRVNLSLLFDDPEEFRERRSMYD